jgi:DNA-binding transcriptional LysR family regulator
MEMAQLKTFVAVAREGNMTRAAAELHLTQPALSAQLARLEEELGQQLFDRTSKGMVLTEAGEVFLDFVRDALTRLNDGRVALEQLQGLARGSLSIGGGATATTYLLPPLLGRYHEVHPGIRFFVREQASAGVVEAVLSGELDLGVVTLPIDSAAGSRVQVEHWVDDELRLIVPPGHELAEKETFEWRDLRGVPLVLFEAGSAVRAHIDSRMDESGVQPEIVMELRSIESIKQMVAQGIGAAFVSQFALAEGSIGLRCTDGPIRRTLAFVYRTDRSVSPAAAAFIELMRTRDA